MEERQENLNEFICRKGIGALLETPEGRELIKEFLDNSN
jgi:hypothetical protein